MSLEISLWKLEDDLTSLIQMREEAGTPEEITVLDEQLRVYFAAEIRKVDNVRAFWRHCEHMIAGATEEARVQSERAHAWKQRLERLKSMCKGVLEMMEWPEGKPKKLEGKTGSISLKGNGGKQPVTITDETLVPDEFVVYEGRIPAFVMNSLRRFVENHGTLELQRDFGGLRLKRVPSLSMISVALEDGGAVAGCRLEPRGVSVVCR